MRLDCNDVVAAAALAATPEAKALAVGPWLGGLAPWILSPAAVGESAWKPPAIPDTFGSANALIVLEGGLKTLVAEGLLVPAFFLPLRWRQNFEDSPRLPADLRRVAVEVKAAIRTASKGSKTPAADPSSWGLDLADCLGNLDLSAFELTADSAWAPLAAGLYVALYGGTPRGDVFATGAWSGTGIKGVTGIAAKVDAVARHFTAASPRFYVPYANRAEALGAAEERVDVRLFERGDTKLLESLKQLLAELSAPPPDGATLDERLQYANQPFVAGDFKRRQQYYRERLVVDLAEKARGREGRVERPVGGLAIGVSPQWELAVLSILALEPERCLLLCTPTTRGDVDQLRVHLNRPNFGEMVIMKDGSGLSDTAIEEVQALEVVAKWLNETENGAVEITGGTKVMTTVLLAAARRSSTRVLYLRHEMFPGSQTQKYGTERIEVLDWV